MQLSTILAGALIVISQSVPAAALSKRAEPLPTLRQYPVDPTTLCGQLSDQAPIARRPCYPPNIDPRWVDVPQPPPTDRVDCCHIDIVSPPHDRQRPLLDTAPE